MWFGAECSGASICSLVCDVVVSSFPPVVIVSCASCSSTACVCDSLIVVAAIDVPTCSLLVASEASSLFVTSLCDLAIIRSVSQPLVCVLPLLCCTNDAVCLVADFTVHANVYGSLVLCLCAVLACFLDMFA